MQVSRRATRKNRSRDTARICWWDDEKWTEVWHTEVWKFVLNTLCWSKEARWSMGVFLKSLDLKIVTETLQFGHQKIDILSLDSRIWDDVSEEVRLIAERLVADHQGAGVHHSRFELGGDLKIMKRCEVVEEQKEKQRIRSVKVKGDWVMRFFCMPEADWDRPIESQLKD